MSRQEDVLLPLAESPELDPRSRSNAGRVPRAVSAVRVPWGSFPSVNGATDVSVAVRGRGWTWISKRDL